MMKQASTNQTPPLEETERWPRERLLAVVLFLATLLALVLCYLIAQPFLPALAWALALAIIAHPLHDWLMRRGAHRNVAAVLTVVIVAVVIVAPIFFVTQRALREAANGVKTIQSGALVERWRALVESNARFAPVLHWAEEQLDLPNTTQRLTAAVTTRVTSFLTNSVWTLAELLITFFFLFYFFRDRKLMMNGLRALVPLSPAETDKVFGRVNDTIYATVYGSLMVSLAQGTLGGLMFWWLGLPVPLLWAAVMSLFALVPMLGTFLIWLPAAAFLALEGNWGKALILVAWGLTAISLIDNLLYPTLVGQRLRMHTVPIFISLVGGLSLFGAAGLVLGPVTLAVTMALLEIWRKRTA